MFRLEHLDGLFDSGRNAAGPLSCVSLLYYTIPLVVSNMLVASCVSPRCLAKCKMSSKRQSSTTQVLSDTIQKQLAVRSALTKRVSLPRVFVFLTDRLVRGGDIAGALGVALDGPPYVPGVNEAKVRPGLFDVPRHLLYYHPTHLSHLHGHWAR